MSLLLPAHRGHSWLVRPSWRRRLEKEIILGISYKTRIKSRRLEKRDYGWTPSKIGIPPVQALDCQTTEYHHWLLKEQGKSQSGNDSFTRTLKSTQEWPLPPAETKSLSWASAAWNIRDQFSSGWGRGSRFAQDIEKTTTLLKNSQHMGWVGCSQDKCSFWKVSSR